MLRKLQFIFFTCQKLMLAHFCKLSYKDRDLLWPNKYRVACYSQLFPAEAKKILRKSQPHIREKLRKLSLKRKSVFLIKKTCSTIYGLFYIFILQHQKLPFIVIYYELLLAEIFFRENIDFSSINSRNTAEALLKHC